MAYIYINLFLSCVCTALIIIRERIHLNELKDKGLKNQQATLFSSNLHKKIIKDSAMLFLIPYPFLIGQKFYVFNKYMNADIFYHYNDVMHMLLLVRLTKALETLLLCTIWRSCSANRVW